MSVQDKMILIFVFLGLLLCFGAILAIFAEKYKQLTEAKKEDEEADVEEVKEKILQMHDYGEFLNQELTNKQNEVMLMYEMLLEKEKKISETMKVPEKEALQGRKETVLPSSLSFTEQKKRRNEVRQNPAQGKHAIPKPEITKKSKEKIIHPVEEPEIALDKEQVKAFHREGLDISEIAKRMQIGKGQVELVLRLYADKEEV